MTQIKLDSGLLKLVTQRLEEHPLYQQLNLRTETEKVKCVLSGFVNGDYLIVHKDELENLVRRVVNDERRNQKTDR